MIFMCDKKCQTAILDRDDGIRQQPPSQFQKQTNGLFCIRVLAENKKEAFRAPYMEKTAETMGVMGTAAARIRREKSERGRFVIPDGSEEGAI